MSTIFVKNIHMLATMDDQSREIADGALLIRDRQIEAVGTTVELHAQIQQNGHTIEETLDLADHLVLPGLINTHHHMSQSMTRAVPTAQNTELYGWLTALRPLWVQMTPEMIHVSSLTAMAELLLSGCTTSSDHLYIYPNACCIDDSLSAAQKIGLRFHACRGSITHDPQHVLPPGVVETEDNVTNDIIRLVDTYHDDKPLAMLRVAVAPGSPFSVSKDYMRESAELARSFKGRGVRLHTHLAETNGDVAFSQEVFGKHPVEFCEEVGWIGDDVWHAHCVRVSDPNIALFARTGTGVAHCPNSNMRLASGVAPIRKMRDAGVRVGLGVDGSASNDAGNMLNEARQAMLLQRSTGNPNGLTAREALEIATRGGASVLGRDDIGYLAPGMAADFIAINLNQLCFAGAMHDPIAAAVFCGPLTVDYSVINGRVVVRGGNLTTIDVCDVIRRHNAFARELVSRAGL